MTEHSLSLSTDEHSLDLWLLSMTFYGLGLLLLLLLLFVLFLQISYTTLMSLFIETCCFDITSDGISFQ